MGIYDKNKKHHNDRENKNKNKNATKKEHEAKKSSLTPFQPLSNNYMERKH